MQPLTKQILIICGTVAVVSIVVAAAMTGNLAQVLSIIAEALPE